MARAQSGNVEIAYEVHALYPDDPPLVLIAGLGAQMMFFEDEFVRGLMDRAFRVIRFDNRDAGESTVFADPVDLGELFTAVLEGREVVPPYSLSDMAGDVVALLDHLEIARAHVLGVSLGGMVAQVLSIEHPDRVASLALLSSSTGNAQVGQPTDDAVAALIEPGPGNDREAIIEHDVRIRRVWATADHWDEGWARDYFAQAYDRGHHPDGGARQMAAILCAADREEVLRNLEVPTVVMHGSEDRLISPTGGARLAELIPGADYVDLEGMGHDLPPHYWAPIIEAVTALAIRTAV